jgi:hypothetical protein
VTRAREKKKKENVRVQNNMRESILMSGGPVKDDVEHISRRERDTSRLSSIRDPGVKPDEQIRFSATMRS